MADEKVIKILNREYYIKEQGDPLVLAALAKYVEDKMIEASQKNNIVDTSRIAVHAALSICEELFKLRNDLDNTVSKQDRKCNQLLEELSKVMES